MKHLKSFDTFLFEAKQINEEKALYDQFAKKVVWAMQTDDIRSTSGNVNGREKKYNILAKNGLYINVFTKEDYDNDKVEVPANMPILYYGGGRDKESELFMKNKKINPENIYNRRELLPLSGNKVDFAKVFNKYDWLPKTVFSKQEAIDGAVGFPVIAKIKNGHSGLGIKKFDTAKELKESKDKFDLFCQFIDFKREYRIVFCRENIIIINERVPTIEDNRSIKTKEADEKISFTYVYQDQGKVPDGFKAEVMRICGDVRKDLDLGLWSLDIVVDNGGKIWVMETSSATGLGSVKMCEVYKAMYEDFYKQPLPAEFLQNIYVNFVVPGHQNYYPKYKKEIESSPWAMDYKILTDPNYEDGYRYFFFSGKTQ